MEATTKKPSAVELPPELAKRAMAIRWRNLRQRLSSYGDGASPAMNQVCGAALCASLGIEGKVAGIADAVTVIGAKMDANLIDQEAALDEMTRIWILIQDGNTEALTEIIHKSDGKADPEEQAEEQPQSKARREFVKLPEMPKVVVREALELMANDPIKGFVDVMRPRWEEAAKAAQADAMAKVQAVLSDVVDQINRYAETASSTGGSVDENTVRGIVHKALNNGAGEEIKKMVTPLVATNIPTVLAEVLDKAARAVASAGPKVEHTAELKAAEVPDADPQYLWTDDMIALCDMLDTASATSPQNILLVGPTGCGKSDFAKQVAARLKRKFFGINCATVEDVRAWFGEKGATGGSTWFRRSQFTMAVEAGGCVILMDEINRVPPHMHNPLMELLDHRRQTYVEAIGEIIKVGPRTIIICACNEGLNHSGVHDMDDAMKNRFPRRVEVGYLPEDKEIKVLMDKTPGLKKADAKNLVELANTVRAKAQGFTGGLSRPISTRQLIAAAHDFVAAGPRSFKWTIFSHYTAENGESSERAQVLKAFEGKGYRFDS